MFLITPQALNSQSILYSNPIFGTFIMRLRVNIIGSDIFGPKTENCGTPKS